MKDVLLYRFLRPFIKFFTTLFFRPKFYGLDNISMTGPVILAGTHTSIFDCLLLISSCKREVHFLAKDELWRFPFGILFSRLGLIPVNRREKDKNAFPLAIKTLKSGLVIGIFPEGTTEKEKGVMLPFKKGACRMSYETDTLIVPFAISGSYRLFSKDLKINFGKPFKVKSNDFDKENDKLKEVVGSLR